MNGIQELMQDTYNGNEKDSFSLPSTNVEHGGNSKGSSQSSHESSEVLPEEMLESSSSKPKSKNGSSVVVVGAWLALKIVLVFIIQAWLWFLLFSKDQLLEWNAFPLCISIYILICNKFRLHLYFNYRSMNFTN